MGADQISAYASRLEPNKAAICSYLREAIETALPKANAKIWRRMPAWFIGENPVVGYFAGRSFVTLLFWNGRRFSDPTLIAVGKFCAAQVKYKTLADVDAIVLQRWLAKSRTRIWDLAGTRNRLLAGLQSF